MTFIIEVKVIPRAHKQAISFDQDGIIKIYLISPAEGGRANKELISFLAERGGVRKSDMALVSGLTTRLKRIKIVTELTKEDFVERLRQER